MMAYPFRLDCAILSALVASIESRCVPLTLRKKAAIDIPILSPQELSNRVEQIETSEQTVANTAADSGPSSEEATRSAGRRRYSDDSVQVPRRTTDDTTQDSAEPEEVLVADVRGGLTPGQMVDQKVQALMGRNYPGFFSQGIGRRGNIGRRPGK